MKELVSWLTTVYICDEKKLRRAFDSMLDQDYENFEIIVVIEYGADEKTVCICEEYKRNNSRIVLLYNEKHLGIAESLNRGIKKCNGKYIARMDADDYSYRDRLSKQVSIIETGDGWDLIGCNARIIVESTGECRYRYDSAPNSKKIQANLLFGTCFSHPTVMIRNGIDGLIYPDRIVEDYALFAMHILDWKMYISNEIVIDYYEGDDNTSNKRFKAVREDSNKISRETIKSILDIDTNEYNDSLFGWRNKDSLTISEKEFLIQAADLYNKILQANNRLCILDNQALLSTVNAEWRKSLWMIRPYSFPLLYKNISQIDDRYILDQFERINGCNDLKGRIIVYGTGFLYAMWNEAISLNQRKHVTYLCDSNPTKWGSVIKNKVIVRSDELHKLDFDSIAIALFDNYDEVYAALVKQGVEDKVIPLPIPERNLYHDYLIELDGLSSKSKPRAFLFCAPDYGNIGDHAIAEAERLFLECIFGLDVIEIPCLFQDDMFHFLDKKIDIEDLLFVTGGGFLGSLWHEANDSVIKVIKKYTNNNIIVFPQTVYWETGFEESIKESMDAYAGHKGKLVLCARDSASLNTMQRLYPSVQSIAVPDMTLWNDWSNYYSGDVKRNGVLLCLKDDKESILDEQKKAKIVQIINRFGERILIDSNNREGRFFKNDRGSLLRGQLSKWAGVKCVVTDRLHGVLFSVITGTPCVALDNCNHKINTLFEWLDECENVIKADNIEDIARCLRTAIDVGCVRRKDSLNYKKSFDELVSIISRIVDQQ